MCGDLLDAVKLATEDVIIVKQQHIRRKAFEIPRNVQISFPATFRPNEMMKR